MKSTNSYLLCTVGKLTPSRLNKTSYYPLKFLNLTTQEYVTAYPTPKTKNFKNWINIIANNELGIYNDIEMWNDKTINAASKVNCTKRLSQTEVDECLKYGVGTKHKPKRPVTTVFNHPLFTIG